MKKLIFIFCAALFCISAKCQIYDGITQPTKYRLFMPVTTSLDGSGTVAAPFAGYRADITSWLSLTPVAQYNLSAEVFTGAMWVNVNYQQKYFLLFRSAYNTQSKKFSETVSGTIKFPAGLMIDGTWENVCNGNKFLDNDRLQFAGGLDCGRFVFNAGYSIRAASGFIANIRFKVTKLNWLQMKYDEGMNAVVTSFALQFNE